MRIKGVLLLGLLVLAYVYYVSWVLLNPFLPEDYKRIFPQQKYVYYLPSLFILLVLTTVMSTLGYILINTEKFNKPIPHPWVKYGYAAPRFN